VAQLTGPEFEALNKALVASFPTLREFDFMVRSKLGVERETEIGPAAAVRFVAMDVIRYAEARGRKLTDLVVGALNMNPDNPDLRTVAITMGLDEGAGEFERIVLKRVPIEHVEDWRSKMMASERAVCRVDFGEEGQGTGFLVGPDLVITNYHVVADVIGGAVQSSSVKLRFDYKKRADGDFVQDGEKYSLAPGQGWLVASSPVAELDYVLMRTQGSPAEGQVAAQEGAPVRDYLKPRAYDFEQGDPLFIIQHPKATPLKFAPGSVDDPQIAPNRVAYTVNTEPGSSGSPCFTSDWNVVALHHWGDTNHNRGVVFSAIMQHWNELGVAVGG
jgi:hypothetical protein